MLGNSQIEKKKDNLEAMVVVRSQGALSTQQARIGHINHQCRHQRCPSLLSKFSTMSTIGTVLASNTRSCPTTPNQPEGLVINSRSQVWSVH